MDLQLRALKEATPAVGKPRGRQGEGVGAHFSSDYMAVVVGEVRRALAKAQMDVAAQQADALLESEVPPSQLASTDLQTAASMVKITVLACMTEGFVCVGLPGVLRVQTA